MVWPEVLRSCESDDDHDSAPALPDQMSSETPRPLSVVAGVLHRIWPVRASAIQESGCVVLSVTL